jgi:signal transduction histidine kinase
MDAEHKERIFDLFYTTKQRGSGLGLPLTQQIVVAHRGQIRCESELGRGTTFTLFFPAGTPARSADPADAVEPADPADPAARTAHLAAES